MAWRTTGSRVAYENPWMRVREDEVVRPDGSPGIFGVVEKPDFALIVPFDGEAFFMVEQYRYPVGRRYAEFPQGSWEDRPDADPVELARAELVEETGLVAGSMRWLGHLFEAYGFSNQGFHVFLATDLAQGVQRLGAGEADLVVRRVPEREFLALVECGDVKDAPTLAAYALFRGFAA